MIAYSPFHSNPRIAVVPGEWVELRPLPGLNIMHIRPSSHHRLLLTLLIAAAPTFWSPGGVSASNDIVLNGNGEALFIHQGDPEDPEGLAGTAMTFRDADGNESTLLRVGDDAPGLPGESIWDFSPYYGLSDNGKVAFIAKLSDTLEVDNGEFEIDGYGGYGGFDTFADWLLDCGSGVGSCTNTQAPTRSWKSLPAASTAAGRS